LPPPPLFFIEGITVLTVAEWNAKTEVVKGQIAEQKYLQATRQLSREKRRLALEDVADKVLETEIQRAEIGLESKKVALQGDKIALQSARDGLRYQTAKATLQQRLWATELMQMEVSLAGSERKLEELRNVAKELNHTVKAVLPKDLFSAGN